MAAVSFIVFDNDVFIYCRLCCVFLSVARCPPSFTGTVSKTPALTQKACGMDAHNIYKWIILSTFTRGVQNMFLLSLIYSIYLSFFPSITYLDNLSIAPVFWINLAKPAQSPSITEATVGVWECCLRMYPNTDTVSAISFPQLNLLPFGLWGPLTAWRVLTGSADYCL